MIKQGIIQDIKNWLDLFEVGNNLFMITDPRVLKLHGDKIIDRLRTKRRDISLYLVPEGRKGKSFTEVNKIYTELAQKRATRDSVIVSLGGGSVGDLAGFIAATYMRGIGLIHIPTTLLAQVDSSIGGKVGVDHPKAKNLIGSFYEPICVITDPQVLLTLDQREFSQGLTEVIKGAIIDSEKLFGFLEANVSRILKRDLEVLLYMIQVSSKIKAKIVEEDPEEKDKRRVLNLGHTIGHAIEILKEEISHGEAVSVGLMAACRLGVKMGILKEEVLERISSLLLRFHLPLKVLGIDPKKVLDVIELDKKIKRKKVFFIVPERIGKVRIVCEPSRELIFESVEETLA
jgi:3-dehydroquinate synthase